MAKNVLTDRAIRNAKGEDKEYLMADGSGLFLRVRPTGAKDWLMVYTFAGKRRKLGLGSLDDVSLAVAREEADKARAAIAQQTDPQLERQEREAAQEAKRAALEREKQRITVLDLFGRWEAVVLAGRKDGGKEIRRLFTKDVLPKLGNMAVEDVKKGHITSVTDALLARGVNRLAKLTFATMRQMFRFAVDRDIIENDPTAAIRKAAIGGKTVERDRVLSEAEIKELRDAIPSASLTPATERAIWICLSTGCRIGELLRARWEHLDMGLGTWRIPEENSKNERAHTVYLSEFALKHFLGLKDINGAGPWCYPNRDETGHVCPKTITVQLGDRQRPEQNPLSKRVAATTALVLSGGRWTPHDLRRTAATMMVSLGALPEVAERCLNHVEENRIKRTYQRHSYEPEMREAWSRLGDRLAILYRKDAGNVVSIRVAA